MGTESGGGEEGSNRPTVTSLRLYLLTGDVHGLDLSHEAGQLSGTDRTTRGLWKGY